MMNIGIILAGGTGVRFKSQTPKQYMKLNGKELIEYSIEAFLKSNKITKTICVVDQVEFESKRIESKFNVTCIQGGLTRNGSIKQALIYIKNNYPNTNIAFIHEAARPLITPLLINQMVDEVEVNNIDAAITAVNITDSIGLKSGHSAKRDDYHLIQAPECFRFDTLYKYFDADSIETSTSHQLPNNSKIKYIYSTNNNIKITHPEDLFLAEQILKYSFFKTSSIDNSAQTSLHNKNALIFGSSGGLGTQIKQEFSKFGITCLCPTKQETNLETLTTTELLDYCAEFSPDIIINSAAYAINDDRDMISEFNKVFSINTKSNLVLIDFARKLKKPVNLVLISSSASTRGRDNLTLYSASKSALNSIVESLAEQLSKENIYVNALIPEKINTPLIKALHKDSISSRELLKTSDVINAILHYANTNEYGKLTHIRKGL